MYKSQHQVPFCTLALSIVIQNDIMTSVIMIVIVLSVNMLNVIMLSIVA
jgi:hypothetical protein